jgi:rubrerythrin
MEYLSYEGLQHYTKSMFKAINERLKGAHLEPINICPQCGAPIADNEHCEYCGAHFKLVVDKENYVK